MTSPTPCYHCALPVPAGSRFTAVVLGEPRSFCCPGCQAVAESIVAGITRAARTLGVETIAEHVETQALATKLRELEVDFGQGFFLGRAQPFARVPGRKQGLRSAS